MNHNKRCLVAVGLSSVCVFMFLIFGVWFLSVADLFEIAIIVFILGGAVIYLIVPLFFKNCEVDIKEPERGLKEKAKIAAAITVLVVGGSGIISVFLSLFNPDYSIEILRLVFNPIFCLLIFIAIYIIAPYLPRSIRFY